MTTATNEELYGALVERCAVDRVWFVQNVLGVSEVEDWQLEVLLALDNGEKRLAIRSGHGVGKTALCAWVIIHFILFRLNVKIPVTAPSSKQLDDGLFPEVNKWLQVLPDFLRAQLKVTDSRIERLDDPSNNFVSFRTARADSPEALAGIHADHVLAVVDEASGVVEAVYEAAQGTMSTPGAIFILIGNPTRPKGYFFRCHTVLRRKWWTRKVSCFDSKRVDRAFITEITDMWGENSAQYRVRVLGEFPDSDANSLIPFELVNSALGRDISISAHWKKIWGVDPGRGGDPSGFVERTGNVITDMEQWADPDTMSITGRIKQKWDNLLASQRPEQINVDSIGLGAGVSDRLREMGLPAVDINVSESAALSERYPRLRPELWYKTREWFHTRNVSILPNKYAPQLVEELSEPEVRFTSTGKNDIETKDSMKARGVRSPNLADALINTFAFEGAILAGRGSFSGKSSWDKPLEMGSLGVF